ncbi:MAG: ATP-binding protein [Candidatus Tyrphobacter sp.]
MNASAQGAATDVVELRIPAKAEWVSIARLAVSAVASRLGFPIEEIEDLKLAVAEALVHAIQHGATSADLLCESLPDGLRIRVRDFGIPSAQTEEIDATAATPGHLGIFLIRALMDSVEYDPRAGGSADLVMFKRLPI